MLRILVSLLTALPIVACNSDDIAFTPADIVGAPIHYDDSGATLHIRSAAVAMETDRDRETNLANMKRMVLELVDDYPDLRLVVFGETALGWYFEPEAPADYQRKVAIRLDDDDPSLTLLRELARRQDIYLAFGAGTLEKGELYNSLVLLDPAGEIAAVHHKIELTDYDIKGGFSFGSKVTVADIDGARAGLMVCADSHSRLLLEGLPDAGIDILLIGLAADMGDLGQKIDPIARMVGGWVVFANRVGTEGPMGYEGFIYISDPVGTIRRRMSGVQGAVVKTLGIWP